METLVIHPRTGKELATVEAILKALDVPFHKQAEGFDPSFAGQMEIGKASVSKEAGHKAHGDDLWKLA